MPSPFTSPTFANPRPKDEFPSWPSTIVQIGMGSWGSSLKVLLALIVDPSSDTLVKGELLSSGPIDVHMVLINSVPTNKKVLSLAISKDPMVTLDVIVRLRALVVFGKGLDNTLGSSKGTQRALRKD